jgi:predicted RNA methylase
MSIRYAFGTYELNAELVQQIKTELKLLKKDVDVNLVPGKIVITLTNINSEFAKHSYDMTMDVEYLKPNVQK